MPDTRRSALVRLAVWPPLVGLLVLDAVVSTPISLSLLYFGPLIAAGLFLPRAETLGVALICSLARLLLEAENPLGLTGVGYALPEDLGRTTSAAVSILAYGSVAFVVGTVGRLRRQVEALGHEVETDPLTGLANRRAFDRALEGSIGREVALLVVDIDHFKRVNDEHGHAAGDRVLRELAERLGASVRGGDVVSRIGGEEFVVLLPNGKETAGAMVARRIVNAVRARPFDVRGTELPITVSVGYAAGPAGPDLLRRADEALYAAKAAGRDRAVAAPQAPAAAA